MAVAQLRDRLLRELQAVEPIFASDVPLLGRDGNLLRHGDVRWMYVIEELDAIEVVAMVM